MGAVRIDLNSDLGENSPGHIVSDDDSMLDIVTSANISCGFHAGTPAGISHTILAAHRRGVTIGAHPAYRDSQNFGRIDIEVDEATLQADVEYQLGAVIGMARGVGASVRYVKPHGALYNTIASDRERARAVVAAIRAVDPSLVFLGLTGGVALEVAESAGLTVAREAFADRAYTAEGKLVSRSDPGAVLHDARRVGERMLELIESGTLESIDGKRIRIEADSICVHGDSPGSVAMATSVRGFLLDAGVSVRSFVAERAA